MVARSEDRLVWTLRLPTQFGSTVIPNGLGTSLGDGIIGLQALSLALEAGTIASDPVPLRLSESVGQQPIPPATHLGRPYRTVQARTAYFAVTP
jgi:hypothetical protein